MRANQDYCITTIEDDASDETQTPSGLYVAKSVVEPSHVLTGVVVSAGRLLAADGSLRTIAVPGDRVWFPKNKCIKLSNGGETYYVVSLIDVVAIEDASVDA